MLAVEFSYFIKRNLKKKKKEKVKEKLNQRPAAHLILSTSFLTRI